MRRPPFVSVVMPVYNAEAWVEAAIESVLAQAGADLELIAVDDGSTDASAEKIRRFGSRVTYLRIENGGASRARNAGVAAAQGELIAFADADDVQHPERIAVQAAALRPDAALIVSDFSEYSQGKIKELRALHHRWLGPIKNSFAAELEKFPESARCRELQLPVREEDRERRVYYGRVPALLASMHFSWAGAMLIRRSDFDAAGGFDPRLRIYEDWDLGSRISKTRPIMYLDAPLFLYRSHGAQLTKRAEENARAYLEVIERVWKSDRAFSAAHGAVVQRALGSAHWQLGLIALERRDFREAEACFLRSVLEYPRQKRAYLDLLRASARRLVDRGKALL